MTYCSLMHLTLSLPLRTSASIASRASSRPCMRAPSHVRYLLHKWQLHFVRPVTTSSTTTKVIEDEEDDFHYHYIEDVEHLHYYTPGGLHPVCIGDILNKRYRLVHKLGSGTFSTTWLARDSILNRLVAVKIARADVDSSEITILSRLNKSRQVKSGCGDVLQAELSHHLIPLLQDSFVTEGPNGKHLCYVTEPADCSLSETKMGGYGGIFRLEVGRVLAAQLAYAVSFVHSSGLLHGDLHLGNVLLRSRHKLDELSDEDLYSQFGSPELEKITRSDGKPVSIGVPEHAVAPIQTGLSYKDLTFKDSRIMLADFGASFSPSEEKRCYSQAPRVVRPPEVRFEPTTPVSYSADIWTLGCAFWDLLAWHSPFNNFFGDQDETTFQQVDTLGPLPASWWDKWETRDEFFTAERTPTKGRTPLPLEERFEASSQEMRKKRGWPIMSSEEKRAFLSMIRWMFSFKPEDRPTIQQVIESEWMQVWALPEYRKQRAEGGER